MKGSIKMGMANVLRGKYFVLCSDDGAFEGKSAFQEFEKLQDALDFILERMADEEGSDLSNYQLVSGRAMELEAEEVITQIRAFHQK
jgi:hypothetical protein